MRQAGNTLVNMLEHYAQKLHHTGAQLVLTELNDRVSDQLALTETIELSGIDRAYHAEPEVFAATRKAVQDAQKQI